jgi:hypothetical protein
MSHDPSLSIIALERIHQQPSGLACAAFIVGRSFTSVPKI